MGEDEARMVKAKRKSKAKQPRKAGKKAKAIKVLKILPRSTSMYEPVGIYFTISIFAVKKI